MTREELEDEFHEWLSRCPVQWFRTYYDKDWAKYEFNLGDELEDNEEEEEDEREFMKYN